MTDRRERLAEARLYLVCDLMSDDFLHACLRGGVDIVQLRNKWRRDDDLLEEGRRYARVCAEHGALFIFNDRPDLAVAAGADGVHVGQDDSSVAEARALVGPERIVGLSTHSPAQIDAAGAADVDYIGVGPVHTTPTKPGRPAVGTELVTYAAAHATLPFFAIGGVDLNTIGAVRAAGATRAAVVRALTSSTHPEATALLLGQALREEVPVGRA